MFLQNTSVTNASKNPTAKLLSQPSISITPLPRSTPQTSAPGSQSQSRAGGKSQFVICEICDGYIKVRFFFNNQIVLKKKKLNVITIFIYFVNSGPGAVKKPHAVDTQS